MSSVIAIILAAGKGTRMKSNIHKVLHPLCGKPMIQHVLDALDGVNLSKRIMVVGYQSESIRKFLKGSQLEYVEQGEQLGTAHAIMQCEELISKHDGHTLIVNGDTPLIGADRLNRLIEKHCKTNSAATVLTSVVKDPTGYGRIIRDDVNDYYIDHIVEQKDATPEALLVNEINTGTYIFDNQKLFAALDKIDNNNAQGEYYLPDVISVLRSQGEAVYAIQLKNPNEALGINDRVQLSRAVKTLSKRILEQHMLNGVTIMDPETVYIEADVEIGTDTIIERGTMIKGRSIIGEESVIGPNSDLEDVRVGNHCNIRHSFVKGTQVEDGVTIGPYAYVRPESYISSNVHIGCFVDIKNSRIGPDSKATHLAYIGDSQIGSNVNMGCGVVTVNYDGHNKHSTNVGDNSFVGCNVNLVAPVTVGQGAYIAAGSTVTEDVPEDSLAIARSRQTTKAGYASRLLSRLERHHK